MKKKRPILKTFILIIVLYILFSLAALARSAYIVFRMKSTALETATYLQNNQSELALRNLFTIEEELSKAKSSQRYAFWLEYTPVIRHDYIIFSEIVAAGSELSTTLRQVLQPIVLKRQEFDSNQILASYGNLYPQFEVFFKRLEKVSQHLDSAHLTFVPPEIQDKLTQFPSFVKAAQNAFDEFEPLIKFFPDLLGQNQRQDILVMIQNPDELRPTGGFIGNIGKISIDKAKLVDFYTDDVYNIDVNALGKEQIAAPEPFKTYGNVQYQYLRDANWLPDFPSTAQHVIKIYGLETNDTGIDTVIAVTPEPVEALLRMTGPIEVDGLTFTADNLVDVIQYRVEQEFWRIGLSDAERKKIINDLAQELKRRIFTFSFEQLEQVFGLLNTSLQNKHVLLYNTNPEIQAELLKRGWGGQIVETKGDYMMVVDTNIGALKTDRVIDRYRNYKVEQLPNGQWKATLRIVYKNNGTFDYRTTRYRTYTRIYVPLGSLLTRSTGFVTKDKSTTYVPPVTYTESGKTVFAGFMSIEPGQERYAEVEYILPAAVQNSIAASGKYELYFQKQPGTEPILNAQILPQNKPSTFAPSDIDYKVENERNIRFTDKPQQDKTYVLTLTDNSQ